MRYLGLFLFALLICAASLACSGSVLTDGWTLTPVADGGNVQLLLGIDNIAELANNPGAVTKTWGDPTQSDPSQFISLGDSGATLQYLSVTLDGDPQVALRFSILNGGDTPLNCYFSSPVVSFAPMSSAKATATAAVTVTDNDGNGASVAGGFTNGYFYHAICNMSTGQQTFCYLVNGTKTADPYSSNIASNNVPPWTGITGGAVNGIWSEFSFTLSGNDSASGTSSFTVLSAPEPGSVASLLTGLLGLAGLAIRRKRS